MSWLDELEVPKKHDLNQKQYQTGYWGVWSTRTDQFVFGVQKLNKKDALNYIRNKTGRPVKRTQFVVRGISERYADDFRQPLKWREDFLWYKIKNERFRTAKRIDEKQKERLK